MPIRRSASKRTCLWHRHDCRFGGGDGSLEQTIADLFNEIAAEKGQPQDHTAESVQRGHEGENPASYGHCRVPTLADQRAKVGIFMTRTQQDAVDASVLALTELLEEAKERARGLDEPHDARPR